MSGLFLSKSRKNDYFGRYGGEEFLFLMSNTELKKGKILAESLARMFREMDIDGMDRPVTFSGGIVQWNGSEGNSELINRADDLLYKAKEAGRNNIQS